MPPTYIQFTKMHGIGNDYIYVHCPGALPADLSALARVVSDRHTGIGGDGLILILPSSIADFRMRIFNADGSEARMCGNGARCVGKYVYDKGLTHGKTEVTLETGGGIKTLRLQVEDSGDGRGKVCRAVTVDMGEPSFNPADVGVAYPGAEMIDCPVATAADGTVGLTAVSMGNPHGVVPVASIPALHFELTGPELEHHAMWADRANIEFVEVVDRGEVNVRVWERGSGETMACGTGACAVVAACSRMGLTDRRVRVNLRGGSLDIYWNPADNHIYMTGPAETVFEGTYQRL